MPTARGETIQEGVEGYYHCISRCVRRAFLCGEDPYSGRSFEHRKAWVRNRLKKLAKAFGIEVLAYAVMSNHLHLVLRSRPDLVEAWSDLETARRWWLVFPQKKNAQGRATEPTEAELRLLAGDRGRTKELRRRLGSVSWFMRCLNENIARRANREDDCKGRFWEGRFKCQVLLDEHALLACMAYVDLNPVRAGVAPTPEQSRFTSIFDRIEGRRRKGPSGRDPAAWLAPIGEEGRPEKNGLFDLTLEDYLDLVDWTGRTLRPDYSGAIPERLEPILDRIGVPPTRWPGVVSGYGSLFRRVAGRADSIRAAAQRLGRKWLCGLKAGRKAFGSG